MDEREDCRAFVALLSRLAGAAGAEGAAVGEEEVAAALFNWREELVVSRAPGRLDVMGGAFWPALSVLCALTTLAQA